MKNFSSPYSRFTVFTFTFIAGREILALALFPQIFSYEGNYAPDSYSLIVNSVSIILFIWSLVEFLIANRVSKSRSPIQILNSFFLITFLIMTLSSLWSVDYIESLRQIASSYSIVMFSASVFVRSYDMHAFVSAMAKAVVLANIAIIASVFLVPEIAVHPLGGEFSNLWRGMYIQKNVAASLGAAGVVLFFYFALVGTISVSAYFLVCTSVIVIWGTGSKTTMLLATLCSSICLVLIVVLRSKKTASISVRFAMAVVLTLVVGSLSFLSDFRFLDDPDAFTGRVRIWQFAMQYASERPFLGYGFMTFYKVYSDATESYLRFAAPHSHNGYIDLYLSAGLLGVGCFLLTCVSCVYAIITAAQNRPIALFFMMFLLYGGLYNLFESSLFEYRRPFCFLVMAILPIITKRNIELSGVGAR